jgi:hypothetical protein
VLRRLEFSGRIACPGSDPGARSQCHELEIRYISPVHTGRQAGGSRNPCAWKRARFEGCKSPSGRCLLPVVKGNCVAVRRGGEQPETNMQSVG